jgi:uncharacterized protein YkwD
MRFTARIAALLIGAIVAVGLAHPAQAQSYVPGDEAKVHDLTNATRTSKGLPKLARNDQLVAMARGQADRMEAKGTIFHNPDLGGEITRRGLDWRRVGENVGMGPNVDLIYAALLDSPKHYENIVRPDYNTLGVGVVDGDDGKRYLVQVFANLATSAPAPAAVKPAAAAANPAPAPPAAAPASSAPQPQAPVATAATAPELPEPSVDPNALTGGYVEPLEVEGSDQGRYLAAAVGGTDSGFDRLVDILAFWS